MDEPWPLLTCTNAEPEPPITLENLRKVYKEFEAQRPKMFMNQDTFDWLKLKGADVDFYKRDIRPLIPLGWVISQDGESLSSTKLLRVMDLAPEETNQEPLTSEGDIE